MDWPKKLMSKTPYRDLKPKQQERKREPKAKCQKIGKKLERDIDNEVNIANWKENELVNQTENAERQTDMEKHDQRAVKKEEKNKEWEWECNPPPQFTLP